MKLIKFLCGFICSLSFIFILIISSFDLIVYGHKSFYKNAYIKYNVTNDISMELDDILYVTDEMLDYLRGNRDNLTVYTNVDGEWREFFNSREKAHMEDVRNLFITGLQYRLYAIIFFFLSLIILLLQKTNWKYIIAKSFQIGSLVFTTCLALLFAIISTDFTKYFDIFHQIFFDNDLYILNPNTDLLINILPEGFFIDMATEIGIVFGIGILLTFIISTLYVKFHKK